MLVALGYDPALSADRVQVTTGSGVEYAPQVELQRLTALGQERYRLRALTTLYRRPVESMGCWVWIFFVACACP
jgi:hypothetical protein